MPEMAACRRSPLFEIGRTNLRRPHGVARLPAPPHLPALKIVRQAGRTGKQVAAIAAFGYGFLLGRLAARPSAGYER